MKKLLYFTLGVAAGATLLTLSKESNRKKLQEQLNSCLNEAEEYCAIRRIKNIPTLLAKSEI